MAKAFEHVAYKHHAPCRKASVHRIFDKEGAEAAFAAAKRFGIKETSAAAWISTFRRDVGDCDSYRAFVADRDAKKAARAAKRAAKKAS